MAEPRPIEDPQWATSKAYNPAGSPSGDVIAPTAGKRTDGWPAPPSSPLPYQTINYLWKILGDFVAHFRDFASSFPGTEGAVTGLAAGEVGFVDSFDPTVAPGEVEQAIAATVDPTAGYSADVDGQYLYSLEGDVGSPVLEVKKRNRENLSIIDATGSFAITGLVTPIATEVVVVANGTHIAVAFENTVRLHLASDGSQVWEYPHGGVVHDLAIDHEAVYLVGAVGTDTTSTARKILFTAGPGVLIEADSAWNFAHGATLLACDTDGVRLYVGGLASGGHSMSAINVTNGTVAPGDPISWDSTSSDQVEVRSIRTDGALLFNIENVGGTRNIKVHGCADGFPSDSRPIGSVAPIGHAGLDQMYYYVVIAGIMSAYSRNDLHQAFFRDRRGVGAAELYGVTSDGDKVFVVGEQSDPLGPSNDNLERVNRATRGTRFTRIDPTTARALPMRQLVIPEGP